MSQCDDDVLIWSERQSALLRRMGAGERVNDQVDWENIAEELEALGKSERRELRNRTATILLHLIKLDASPAGSPRPNWREMVREQRRRLRRVLQESPSLRETLSAVIADELPEAREEARASLADHDEAPLIDLKRLCYTEGQLLGPWLPS